MSVHIANNVASLTSIAGGDILLAVVIILSGLSVQSIGGNVFQPAPLPYSGPSITAIPTCTMLDITVVLSLFCPVGLLVPLYCAWLLAPPTHPIRLPALTCCPIFNAGFIALRCRYTIYACPLYGLSSFNPTCSP